MPVKVASAGFRAELLDGRPHCPRLDVWYKAFDVKPDDKLYLAPEERVKVW